MGGATENDQAMQWFLERANGGDILVLRASGSDGYNDYLYSELGVNVNSVETIVFQYADASEEEYIHERIAQAEAIWFAGGDQWNYVDYWRDSPVEDLINEAIEERNIVIGGTSAGMAILGGVYFSAENGTITSSTALNNPYHSNMTVDTTAFLRAPFMNKIITDTHYDDPDRRGRHVAFIARGTEKLGEPVFGLACDEYTAACIDENGMAYTFGDAPEYEDYVYFVYANCEIENNVPEIMEPDTPLTWNKDSVAVHVLRIPGTNEGEYYLDLNNWSDNQGAEYFKWFVVDGVLHDESSMQISCSPNKIENVDSEMLQSVEVFPNPSNGIISVDFSAEEQFKLDVYSLSGRLLCSQNVNNYSGQIDLTMLNSGLYLLAFTSETGEVSRFNLLLE